MMSERKWMNQLTPVAGGIALALVLIGSAVAHADYTTCQQCRDYWSYYYANTTVANGGCKDFVSTSQSNNKGKCINDKVDAQCKATCDANPIPVQTTTCAGEDGVKDACRTQTGTSGDDASGPCNQNCWGATCNSSDSTKRCILKQVNQTSTKVLLSPCYVNCDCGQQ